MAINLFSRVVPAIALFSASVLTAQNFQNLYVASGYNADVIANDVGSAMVTTTTDVDGVSYAFVSRDFKLTATSNPITYGLPVNGIINSVATSTPGLSFQLADYYGNNSLRINSNTAGSNSGTIVFSTPVPAFKLYMLSTSGSGVSTVDVTVTFTDNTTQVFTGQNISDWYGGADFAIQGIGRILRTSNGLESNTTNPRLYQTAFAMDAANQSKPIQSVTVTKTNSSGVMNVFAFSVDAFSTCASPVLQDPTGVTANSAQIAWTVPTGTQAASHDIYYSTSATPPAANVTPNYSDVQGLSYTLNNLASSTTYYCWVRTNCFGATSKSAWSFSKTFTTLCGAVVPSYTNDFTVFPGNCWAANLSGGTPDTNPTGSSTYWAQRNFLNTAANGPSAHMNIYSSGRTGWFKTVPFNLSAGGYRVKFRYGVTTYSGTAASVMGSDDVVHFMVSDNGGSTWTILQTWNANNGPSNTSNDFTYDLANFTGGSTVFAFYGSSGTTYDNQDYNFYVDDFTVENALLGTSEVKRQVKTVAVHPNPFKDILYLSDVKDLKKVTVGDASGRIVKTVEGSVTEINLSELNSGLYFVTLYFKDGSQSTVKAIKK
ncbi:T9SS type A sorting domain-containing protein [Chryseobacterium sp. JK1]|uniref:T9SS type A sorting domain-containing protein n=1 Tax=Chryseobacterium sp. JK1 TaxID=874294 RepID=UPI003D69E263